VQLITPIPLTATALPTHRTLPKLSEDGKTQIVVNGKKQWLKFPISHVWPYHTAEGLISHYVVRYYNDTKESKETPPMCWSDAGKWVFHALPEPRILFNLHLLKKYPTAQVLIVEGEKSADAATKLFTEAGRISQVVPITWQGGAASIYKADWTPVVNRLCLLWPDNDLHLDEAGLLIPKEKQAGYVAMLSIAGILINGGNNG
jgi:putative DNA primase/helicase